MVKHMRLVQHVWFGWMRLLVADAQQTTQDSSSSRSSSSDSVPAGSYNAPGTSASRQSLMLWLDWVT
jgi:hypothetical protein